MTIKKYYYLDSNQKPAGPFSIEELSNLSAQGKMNHKTLVAEDGGSAWVAWKSFAPKENVEKYYYLDENRKPIGPFSFSLLSALAMKGDIKPDTLVAKDGDTRWLAWRFMQVISPEKTGSTSQFANQSVQSVSEQFRGRDKKSWQVVLYILVLLSIAGGIIVYSHYKSPFNVLNGVGDESVLPFISQQQTAAEAPTANTDSISDSASATPHIRMLSAGYEHTCALDDSGVHCWGRNENGETDVPPLANPVAVSAGSGHTCALDNNGVHCWGENDYAGATVVPPLIKPVAVSAGDEGTCVLDDNGVHCWGKDSCSLDRSVNCRQISGPKLVRTPEPILNHPVAVSLSGGILSSSRVCALDDNGVHCWGDEHIAGQNRYGKTDVPPLVNPVAVSAGNSGTCALDDNGVHCWGYSGDDWSDVPLLVNPVAVSAGNSHFCALDDNGVHCWGANSPATVVPPLVNPVAVSAGGSHTCALDDNGVQCWGDNEYGQINVPPVLRRKREVVYSNSEADFLTRFTAELSEYAAPMCAKTSMGFCGDMDPCSSINEVFVKAGITDKNKQSAITQAACNTLQPIELRQVMVSTLYKKSDKQGSAEQAEKWATYARDINKTYITYLALYQVSRESENSNKYKALRDQAARYGVKAAIQSKIAELQNSSEPNSYIQQQAWYLIGSLDFSGGASVLNELDEPVRDALGYLLVREKEYEKVQRKKWSNTASRVLTPAMDVAPSLVALHMDVLPAYKQLHEEATVEIAATEKWLEENKKDLNMAQQKADSCSQLIEVIEISKKNLQADKDLGRINIVAQCEKEINVTERIYVSQADRVLSANYKNTELADSLCLTGLELMRRSACKIHDL